MWASILLVLRSLRLGGTQFTKGGKMKSLWPRWGIPASFSISCDPVTKSLHRKCDETWCMCVFWQPTLLKTSQECCATHSPLLTGRDESDSSHLRCHMLEDKASLDLGPRNTCLMHSHFCLDAWGGLSESEILVLKGPKFGESVNRLASLIQLSTSRSSRCKKDSVTVWHVPEPLGLQ